MVLPACVPGREPCLPLVCGSIITPESRSHRCHDCGVQPKTTGIWRATSEGRNAEGPCRCQPGPVDWCKRRCNAKEWPRAEACTNRNRRTGFSNCEVVKT